MIGNIPKGQARVFSLTGCEGDQDRDVLVGNILVSRMPAYALIESALFIMLYLLSL